MSDTQELLRRGVGGFEPAPDAFERVLVRRDRKRRNRRVAAGIVGIAVFLIAAAGFARLLGSERTTPADPEPAPPRAGWMVFSAAHIDPEAKYPNRGTKFDLFVGGPDGSARLLVGAGARTTLGCPAFSPDGSLLAYGSASQRQGVVGGLMEVVVIAFTSSGELRGGEDAFIVSASSDLVAPCPAWSPDGRRLATIVPDHGVMFINLGLIRNSVRIPDPDLAEGVKGLEWSPDGSRVAVLLWPTGSDQSLWIAPAFGGVARSVPGFGEGYRAETVAWAPDGRSVVVGGSWGPSSEALPFVKLVDVATGDATDVPLPGAWDGSTIMRVFPIGDDRFLVERAATGWQTPELLDLQGNVTSLGAEFPVASFISLSPDGTQVLYVASDPTRASPGMAVVAVPLDGGEPTRYSPWSKGFGDNYATFSWRPR